MDQKLFAVERVGFKVSSTELQSNNKNVIQESEE